jgi:branched-chain amino acid transport system substrate-binding protein
MNSKNSIWFGLGLLVCLLSTSVCEAQWTTAFDGFSGEVKCMWTSPNGFIYAGNNEGEIIRYDGSWSVTKTSAITSKWDYVTGIWGFSDDSIYAVMNDGTILHFDGNRWIPMQSPDIYGLLSIWGSSSNNLFACGRDNTILQYDGSQWKKISLYFYSEDPDAYMFNPPALNDIWGNSSNDVFAVGDGGLVYHYDGSRWRQMFTGTEEYPTDPWADNRHLTEERLYGVWGDASNNVYVVGYRGTIMHYDGHDWTLMPSPTDKILYDVYGTSKYGVFAVGWDGTILNNNGMGWLPMENTFSDKFVGITANTDSTVFLGGNGRILQLKGDPSLTIAPIKDQILSRNLETEIIVDFKAYNGTYSTMDFSVESDNPLVLPNSTNNLRLSQASGKNGTYSVTITYTPDIKQLGEVKITISALTEDSSCSRSFNVNIVNSDNYELVLTDDFGDSYYLDPSTSLTPGFTHYRGILISDLNIYDCALLYGNASKTIALTASYKHDQIISYNLTEQSPDLYAGTYIPFRSDGDNVSARPITLTLIKGMFPEQSIQTASVQGFSVPFIPSMPLGSMVPESNVLKLGALIPQSGGLQSLGDAFTQMLQLAKEDSQNYLNDIGNDLTVELFVEDNQTSPSESWHRIQALRQAGVSVFLGPQDSKSVDYIKKFADDEDYLLMSSTSTAIGLSIPNDNVMRNISDDTQQAAALIKRIQSDGITELVIVSRTDLYGRGFCQALEKGWEEQGGIVKEVITYTKPYIDIPDVLQELRSSLSSGFFFEENENTGVILIAFDEGIDLMEKASESSELSGVRWYGTDSLSQNHSLLNNPVAANFAAETSFTCSTFAIPESEAYSKVVEIITSRLGYEPPSNTVLIYDSYQLALRAYLEAGTDDPSAMKAALNQVAETYQGISGNLRFNANGDRAEGTYNFWSVVKNEDQYYWNLNSNNTGEPVSILEWALY